MFEFLTKTGFDFNFFQELTTPIIIRVVIHFTFYKHPPIFLPPFLIKFLFRKFYKTLLLDRRRMFRTPRTRTPAPRSIRLP